MFSSLSKTLIFLLGMCLAGFAMPADVDDIRMWRAPDHTRLVFDLSGAVDYELFTLTGPDRVVIDINDTAMRGNIDGLDFSDSPITAIRSGARDNNQLRVVLDLTAKVDPRSFTLPPNQEFGNRLVIDLYDLGPAPPASPSVANTPPPLDGKRDIVIAISAGHGGEDPGSIGYDGRIMEKNVTLAISRYLEDQLNSMPGYRPVMIRDGDYYVQLDQRPEIARRERADLFVAVHADAFRSSRANGATIYALSGDRADRENSRRVSQKENSSDLLGGVDGDITLGTFDDDVALTLVSLQMAWSMEQSLIAGTHVLQSMDGIARLRRDKVQQASLQVLNSPDIPSILVETGYLTNPGDADRLKSADYQRLMASALAQGIANYFYESPPEGTLIAWNKRNGILPGSYTVKRGDNLSEIALRFGLSLSELKRLNNLTSNTIQIGQRLTLPGNEPVRASEHMIRRGETLSEIAERYRVNLSSLRQANNISGDRIMVGQILKIPTS
ncbi:MAG: N-acetylmuramoyl-L-alanine amidase [Gammaproteobacteria bacterium]